MSHVVHKATKLNDNLYEVRKEIDGELSEYCSHFYSESELLEFLRSDRVTAYTYTVVKATPSKPPVTVFEMHDELHDAITLELAGELLGGKAIEWESNEDGGAMVTCDDNGHRVEVTFDEGAWSRILTDSANALSEEVEEGFYAIISSSGGRFVIDKGTGEILHREGSSLPDVIRFDVGGYYIAYGRTIPDTLDILHIAYWTTDGKKEPVAL